MTSSLKVAFYSNQLCIRGTTTALFDYAFHNISILQNQSIILYNPNSPLNDFDVIAKFKTAFPDCVFEITHFKKDIDDFLVQQGCDVLYMIKYGINDGHVSRTTKTVVHCVFRANDPHGDVYASISPGVQGNHGRFPVVPHMVSLNTLITPKQERTTMREKLNIPLNAVVFGRHGGFREFDIPFVQKTVFRVALECPHIYFVFVNTRVFCTPLPNIIHLDKIVDLQKKICFIDTCDAMIWARSEGETFGLAIAEFSTLGKPVFCTRAEKGDNVHLDLLRDKAVLYNGETDLYLKLNAFNRDVAKEYDWNAYSDFTPEKVMKQFQHVFLTF